MVKTMFNIIPVQDVEVHKQLIPEPITQRVELDYGDANAWMRTWIWLKSPNQVQVMVDWYFTLPDGQQGLIKEGFIYDGASIPFFARPLLRALGILNRGGGIHDYGYRFNHLRDWEGNKIYVGNGKQFFDTLFREVGKYTSHLKGIAGTAWLAVKMFGKVSWNKHRKNNLTDDYLYEKIV
jgi:hypothetical protein